MRKLVVAAFLSVDGVMQAPGGAGEDPSGGFRHEGWSVPYFDDVMGAALSESFSTPFDLLLGRRTYDIFAAHWPRIETDPTAEGYDPMEGPMADRFNRATKHVATHSPDTLSWQNSKPLGEDVVATLLDLKKEEGPILLVQGSSALIQTLLAADLIDEFRMVICPLVLGRGKRLFGDGTMPAAFRLVKWGAAPTGVLIANYERAGDVRTGTFALTGG